MVFVSLLDSGNVGRMGLCQSVKCSGISWLSALGWRTHVCTVQSSKAGECLDRGPCGPSKSILGNRQASQPWRSVADADESWCSVVCCRLSGLASHCSEPFWLHRCLESNSVDGLTYRPTYATPHHGTSPLIVPVPACSVWDASRCQAAAQSSTHIHHRSQDFGYCLQCQPHATSNPTHLVGPQPVRSRRWDTRFPRVSCTVIVPHKIVVDQESSH